MTVASDDAHASAAAARRARREKVFAAIDRTAGYLSVLGLGWLVPLLKIAAGDSPREQVKALWQGLFIPLIGILVFLAAWAYLAPKVETSLGAVPGPVQVWDQTVNLWQDHKAERAKEEQFYQRLEVRNEKLIAEGHADRVKWRAYTGKPTYIDQIFTSLKTVALGFLIATLVAVPVGIMCGLSRNVNAGLNPLIQIFKPVSPLAWLPIVTMVVSALIWTRPTRCPNRW